MFIFPFKRFELKFVPKRRFKGQMHLQARKGSILLVHAPYMYDATIGKYGRVT
jgi:hypothetical protein